jgi:hypothetical protein
MNEEYAQYLGRTYGRRAEEVYRNLPPLPPGKCLPPKPPTFLKCEECGIEFQKKLDKGSLRFCGRSCAMKHTRRLQIQAKNNGKKAK